MRLWYDEQLGLNQLFRDRRAVEFQDDRPRRLVMDGSRRGSLPVFDSP
jgi:hypothetical protein